jgi:hypothetical protein
MLRRSRRDIDLPQGSTGAAFLELLEVMADKARTVGLVASRFELDNPPFPLLSALDDRLLRREETRAWPGAEVPDWAPPSVLLTFAYDRDVARILYEHSPAMLGWQARGFRTTCTSPTPRDRRSSAP